MKRYLMPYLKIIKEDFKDERSGHDKLHMLRVLSLAQTIQKSEGGKLYVIEVSSLLHDYHRLLQNRLGKSCTPEQSLPEIEKILQFGGASSDLNEQIVYSIKFHEEYQFLGKQSVHPIETQILQDADRLDAIGAIGIVRTAYYSSAHGSPMWDPDKPLKNDGTYSDGDSDPSMIHHCHNKLLRLADNMNTATGKKIAEERHKFMEAFIDRFMSEWNGN